MRKMIAAMNMSLDGFCDLDKLIDELSKGKKMEKILRTDE
ncbi:MAG TPA: DUF2200 family protein [Pyrinomonadaceae bacterium]|nr:DUF2200 family protein [Pyrinomonadaceae bacterium]